MSTTTLNGAASNIVVNPAIINPNVKSENLLPKASEKKEEKKEVKATEKKQSSKQKKADTAKKTQVNTAVKTAPKRVNRAVSTQKDALKALRDANKETKTLSGVVKTIRTFWKDGYSEAFKFLNMTFNDIDVKKIMSMWSDSLKDETGVFMYKSRVAKFKMDKDGNKEYLLDKDGKRIYVTVLKQYNNNFSVLRLFDAMLTVKIEKGEIAL